MALTSTTTRTNLRLVYAEQQPNFRLSGVNPDGSFMNFIGAVQSIQTGTVNQAFLSVESELTEA